MILSELEKDILGDMQHDTHELWEWYSFIRTHHPSMPENEVIEFGYSLFEIWVKREWLIFYKSRKDSSTLSPDEFLQLIRSMGESASNPEYAIMVLELSTKVKKDIDWLRPMGIVGPE